MSQIHITSVGLSQEGKSPYWVAQWTFADGKRMNRSTKVPVAGGVFRGGGGARVQAKNRALLLAQELTNAAAVEAKRVDNMSVRELFDKMLGGSWGVCLWRRIIMPGLLIVIFVSGSGSGRRSLLVW